MKGGTQADKRRGRWRWREREQAAAESLRAMEVLTVGRKASVYGVGAFQSGRAAEYMQAD